MMRVNVGIDVSKIKLDCCIFLSPNNHEYLTILNKPQSIKDFIDYLLDEYPNAEIFIGYEATSTYMVPLQKVLEEYPQIHSKMINPYYLHHFFKFKGIKEKTDKVDSYGIALFISEQTEEFFTKDSYHYRKIFQPYVTTLEHLKKLKTSLKNLMHSQKELIDDSIAEQIKDIEQKIKDVEKEVERRAKKRMKKEIPESEELLKEIKGIGFTTLLYTLPYIADNCDSKTPKQFQAYFGLNPIQYQSGQTILKNPKISKRGNASVRKVLFMSALVSSRINPIIKEKYNRFIAQGKKKKVALIACASHLLRAIYFRYIHLHKRLAV